MPVELRTNRLLIRIIREDDGLACITAFTDSREFWRPWMPTVNNGDSPEVQFEKRIERSAKGWSDGSAFRFVAFALDTGEYAGDCGLNNVVRDSYQNADMGWRVCRGRAGKGFAREMIRAVLTWAFTPMGDNEDLSRGAGLHRVRANIIPANEPSLKLARALGFREEGYAKAMLHLDGAWRDHVMFAIVAEEWKP
ncbi:MAG: GNAT family N-acetyltransferase [Phycisphaerales bacterium]